MMRHLSLSRIARRLAPAVLLAAAACASTQKGPPQPRAVIIFQNQSLDQATVYIVSPSIDFIRLGTVFAGRTETLRVPTTVNLNGGSLNIVARLLARPELPQTGPVTINAGETYRVTLPPDGRLLSFLPNGP